MTETILLLGSKYAHEFHAEWPPYLVTKCNLWAKTTLRKGTLAEAFDLGLEPCPYCQNPRGGSLVICGKPSTDVDKCPGNDTTDAAAQAAEVGDAGGNDG